MCGWIRYFIPIDSKNNFFHEFFYFDYRAHRKTVGHFRNDEHIDKEQSILIKHKWTGLSFRRSYTNAYVQHFTLQI